MSRKSKLYREYDEEGQLIKLECSNCHVIKTVDNFYKRKNIKDGVVTKCKKCTCERQKQYQLEHKEEIAEYSRKYYEDNKEKLKEYNQQYRENNKEKISENYKQYYQENKQSIMTQHTEYRKNKNRLKLKYGGLDMNNELNSIRDIKFEFVFKSLNILE